MASWTISRSVAFHKFKFGHKNGIKIAKNVSVSEAKYISGKMRRAYPENFKLTCHFMCHVNEFEAQIADEN